MIKNIHPSLYIDICSILNQSLEKHEDLDVGYGTLVALQKLGKPKGLTKNPATTMHTDRTEVPHT